MLPDLELTSPHGATSLSCLNDLQSQVGLARRERDAPCDFKAEANHTGPKTYAEVLFCHLRGPPSKFLQRAHRPRPR